jgi:hypothetical protein
LASSNVAPASSPIGHLKNDHRMGRSFLARSSGDAIKAMLAAVGYNLCCSFYGRGF